jgi:hypothetical protein
MTVYTIFFMLKLMSVGHPASKPYYEEICSRVWPIQQLESCEATLVTIAFTRRSKLGTD